MRVLHALNYHRGSGGSDKAWDATITAAAERGMEIGVFSRDSRALPPSLRGKTRAALSGVYSRDAVRGFEEMLATFRPDVVHTHELYPLISPWILRTCYARGVPAVHSCYDYRLTCPIATHFANGRVCRDCVGGREYWALLNNCRDSLAESASYGLRSAVARVFGLFDNVTHFLVASEFSRQWLIRDVGVAANRVTVHHPIIAIPETAADPSAGTYVAYAGRFAFEKGVHVLLDAARRTGLPVRLAGSAETHEAIRAGDHVECVVTRTREELASFYRGARMLVVPSIWEETFGIVAAEAMSHGIPVVAARIGALPDTVVDGITGLLFESGNPDALAEAMRRLWADPALCRKLGAAARSRVAKEFNKASHIRQLIAAYERATAAGARHMTVTRA